MINHTSLSIITIEEHENLTELPNIGEENGLKPSAGNALTPQMIENNLLLDRQTLIANYTDNIEISRHIQIHALLQNKTT